MKRTIRTLGVNETNESHRRDFQTCPYCDAEYDLKKWEKNAHQLVLSPLNYHKGCVALWTECGKCFEPSWVHIPFSAIRFYDYFPKKWKEKVESHEKTLRIQAANNWCNKLCNNCRNLEDVDITYHAWRYCSIGSGPPLTECSHFVNKGTLK